MPGLEDWYHVRFDEQVFRREVAPPGGESWSDQVPWRDIVRVCYMTRDALESDELYVFCSSRPESYVIPMEADGGLALLNELVRRELFPAQLAIEAAGSNGALYCWPPAGPNSESA